MELQSTLPSAVRDSHKKKKKKLSSSSSISREDKGKRPVATAIEDDAADAAYAYADADADADDDNGMSAGGNKGDGLSIKKRKKRSEDDFDESDYEKDELAADQQLQVEKHNTAAHNRLWREQDEIALLQGMVHFSRTNGLRNPMSRSADFQEFIKDSFPFDLSKRQLSDKVFRLKKKYETNLKDHPRTTTSLNEHEKVCFGLSHEIWGGAATHLEPIEEEDNPPVALARGSRGCSVLNSGDFVDGLCIRCLAGSHDLGHDVLEKMKKPVCKDAKLVRKWKDLEWAQIVAAEKHADFLKTDARLLIRTIEQEDD